MKALHKQISDLSKHLQSLSSPEFFPEVNTAVEKQDKKSLTNICIKANIPTSYRSSIVSFLMSAEPQAKWPEYI